MESQGVWRRFKKFKLRNYAKVYPRSLGCSQVSDSLDMIKFCNYRLLGNLTKKTPEDTKTVFKVGSGAIARTEIVNN